MPGLLGAVAAPGATASKKDSAEAGADANAAEEFEQPSMEEEPCTSKEAANFDSAADEDREPSSLLLLLLCAVSALEGADTQLLPSAMFALQKDVGLKITDLAYLNTAQAVCTNIAAPLWGILADRGILRRKTILILGSLGQGIVTIVLGCTTGYIGPVVGPMIVLRTAEGALLAALRPISNGIIADVTSENRRGKIFGRVQSSLLFGMFVSVMTAVPMSNKQIFGVQGWRVAFVILGLLAASVSGLVATCLVEPPREDHFRAATAASVDGSEARPAARRFGCCRAVAEEAKDLLRFFTIPTFGVMIMQGIFGTIPWSVMGNMTLFFQLCGIDDTKAAVLSGEQMVAGALGNLFGGYVADYLARRCGYHGRPLNAQITVAIGLPIIYLIFSGIPPGSGTFTLYFFLIAAFGLFGSWAQSGTNFPILSEIVPSSSRSKVMAWECAVENSIANALGPPVVALLATKAFGYKFGEDASGAVNLESAKALGKAMTAVVCIPFACCLVAYSLLHWSYPRDVRRLALKAQQAKEQQQLDGQDEFEQRAAKEPHSVSPTRPRVAEAAVAAARAPAESDADVGGDVDV